MIGETAAILASASDANIGSHFVEETTTSFDPAAPHDG